jgi:hypothetical protein
MKYFSVLFRDALMRSTLGSSHRCSNAIFIQLWALLSTLCNWVRNRCQKTGGGASTCADAYSLKN